MSALDGLSRGRRDGPGGPRTLTLAAPAKLNLYLEVLGRRSDGYHELETVFQTIELADTVTVELAPGGSGIVLSCDDPGLPVDAGNLAWRAAAAYLAGSMDAVGAVRLTLAKAIPHGAGLGGGSSDAGAVLRALSRLLPGWYSASELAGLAAGIGSDVPFFLIGGTAWATGRGERLGALPDLPPLPLTVLMPQAMQPTPAVFAALTAAERGPRAARGEEWWRTAIDGSDAARLAGLLHNRLTAPACRLCPPLRDLLDQLTAARVPCLMSGSGSACLALAEVAPPAGVRAWRTRLRPRAGLDALDALS
jgi:4-diphosphocytidyl-2-C-methyl-D-erythritol kinase